MPPIEVPARLDGERCALRPYVDADIPAWARMFVDDPELGVSVGFDEDPDEESLQGRPQKNEEGAAAGEWVDLAIVEPDTDRLLGGVVLMEFDWRHMRAEVGFWLAPAARGRGVATEAVGLGVGWAFSALGMHRVEMTTLTDSDRVLALAERLGFRREGVMRERNFERGRRVDIVMLAVLQSDWAFPPK